MRTSYALAMLAGAAVAYDKNTLGPRDFPAEVQDFSFAESTFTNEAYRGYINYDADTFIAIEAFMMELTTLRKKTAQLEKDANEVKTVLRPKIKGDLGTLQATVEQNRQQIATNATNITNNKTEIGKLQERLEDLKKRVAINADGLILFCHRWLYAPVTPTECGWVYEDPANHLKDVYWAAFL